MSFDFIPRSVKRRKLGNPKLAPSTHQVSTSVESHPIPAGALVASGQTLSHEEDSKGFTKRNFPDDNDGDEQTNQQDVPPKSQSIYDLDDLAALLWLALSDYAFWADPDLRRRIDTAGHEQEVGQSATGYVPLSYLLKHSPVMLQAASASSYVKLPETAFVKAIRSHASNCLDVRMIVPDSKSSSHWSSKLLSGYEVRRKDKDEAIGRNGKSDWEDLTLYVENIPIQHRTIPSIARFISSLLDSEQDDCTRVQSISFPRHHNDQPDSYPSIKGFAIVTLSRKSDVQLLLEEWPWDSSVERGKGSTKPHKDQNRQSPDQVDARKSGFRCLTKTRWEELKAEYLLYRQQLIEELAAEDEVQPVLLPPPSSQPSETVLKSETASRPEERQTESEKSRPASSIHAGSPFPSGCLVFVRHVHPETNKTTLRTLFSQAWDKASSQDAEKLDYMDYSKGLDSCYIRLSSPSHADHLVQYFIEHPTLQTSGLDAAGTPSSSGDTANNYLIPELVTGKREELYWQKVPEKIRKQAVDKALKTMQSTGGHTKSPIAAGDQGKVDGKLKRKR